MDAAASILVADWSFIEEKDVLPIEAFAKVKEIFSYVDWLDPKADAALNVLQKITASNIVQERLDTEPHHNVETSTLLQELIPEELRGKQKPTVSEVNSNSPVSLALENQSMPSKLSPHADVREKKAEPQDLEVALQQPSHSDVVLQQTPLSSQSNPVYCNSIQVSPVVVSRCHSAPSALRVAPLLHDHAVSKSAEQKNVSISPPTPPPPPPLRPSLTASATKTPTTLPPPPVPPHHLAASNPMHRSLNKQPETNLQGRGRSTLVSSLPAPETPFSGSTSDKSIAIPPSLSSGPVIASSTPLPPPTPPPPPTLLPPRTPPLKESRAIRAGPPPPPPPPLRSGQAAGPTSVPPPPPPAPAFSSKRFDPASQNSSFVPSAPPPPVPFGKGVPKIGAVSPESFSVRNGDNSLSGSPFSSPTSAKGRSLLRTSSRSHHTKKLKPLHWLKLTRAAQGTLWAEAQKSGEASKAPEIDMSELESLFSAAVPNLEHGRSGGKSNLHSSGPKSDKVQLIEHRRAYNCEIMLSKVKVPLHDLMSSVLALEDSALDVDQVDNLIKFCPTKEDMELLKAYNGEKEKLGKCEQFFLELMQVPRVESKLRVFSFKIQFCSQVSDLRKSLNVVNSAAEEIRNSEKLKRIMQTILSLGNALNQGTARGSAIGFRMDSLLKLTDMRARNSKMTLMHYLCKVLADKLPELLDFSKDLTSLEPASKIQLKFLAEEMQSISKGLEKVVQELAISENDGPISENFCKTLKEFLSFAEAEVRSLASLYSGAGRNVDALILYFGEDPSRCPFEQVVSTLLNFVRMFGRAHEENCKQLELEKKKAEKESESEKLKIRASQESEQLLHTPVK